jgi:hypothetical protein
MQGPWLQAGRCAERRGQAYETPLPVGCLYNVDSGYFTLTDMRAHSQNGCFWLTPAKASVLLIDQQGQCWDLVSLLQAHKGDEVALEVFLGKQERVPARLIARRVSAAQAQRRRERANRDVEGKLKGVRRPNERTKPKAGKRERQRKRHKVGKARLQLLEWTILVTNVPREKLSVDEALVLARCRWQIELCWKLWKQVGKLDTWRSANPERILSELYAKLVGLLITHWLTLIECWAAPNRSVVQAHQVAQWMAPALALGVAGVVPLESMVHCTSTSMASGCTITSRRSKPSTFQLVAQPKLIRGFG